MSDATVVEKPKKASKPSSSRVTLSSVYAAKASKNKTDTTRAAKLIRSRLRGNFAEVCKLDRDIKKHKQAPNDKKPWPKTITRDLAKFLLS